MKQTALPCSQTNAILWMAWFMTIGEKADPGRVTVSPSTDIYAMVWLQRDEHRSRFEPLYFQTI